MAAAAALSTSNSTNNNNNNNYQNSLSVPGSSGTAAAAAAAAPPSKTLSITGSMLNLSSAFLSGSFDEMEGKQILTLLDYFKKLIIFSLFSIKCLTTKIFLYIFLCYLGQANTGLPS